MQDFHVDDDDDDNDDCDDDDDDDDKKGCFLSFTIFICCKDTIPLEKKIKTIFTNRMILHFPYIDRIFTSVQTIKCCLW